ncbi:MAG: isoprenylcysteine carboxylmethyltransferase family protein [Candidatus Nitrohelix vancouverensis]|uniref:Isoprenylcysteine carboxylmethyltransferase family protein n=1 Tax=Candidatus Nitrohelix vancouverensis TaxID=2705534 RepID=A0A7T0G2I5_9BACT|nr:MAG: isoprenylcysteine carboxylmethyltransferase family protein [Candidatus Nitrohelix vancouverensis]
MKLSRSLIFAFFLFPFNVMGVIPGILLWLSQKGRVLEFFDMHFSPFRTAAALLLIGLGVYLCWKTVSLFTTHGDGTPAPFDPPKKLVALGIYRHTRNPMMLGVWYVLLGEAALFGSTPIFLWGLLFILGCLVLIPFWEEPDLEKRFGASYLTYKNNVPRWLPRIKAWDGRSAS